MKIIYQGDLHLRSTTPVNRIDNYFEAQFDKLRQLVKFVNSHRAWLLLGGDIFDTHKVTAETVNRTVNIFSQCLPAIRFVLGQHDVPFHQVSLMKSPVYSLCAGCGGDLDDVDVDQSVTYQVNGKPHSIHYCSWEQTPTKPQPGVFNILLAHISVFENKIPFYWKGEGYTAKSLKEKYPGFNLYLCGDIHIPFVKDNVVVSGSMMRQSIDQIDYKPRCYLIDTETMDIKPLYYKINPDVFSAKADVISEVLDFDNLIKAMKSSAEGRASYKRDCLALSQDDEPVKKIIQGVFDDFD